MIRLFFEYLFGGMILTTIGLLIYALIVECISDFKYYVNKFSKGK